MQRSGVSAKRAGPYGVLKQQTLQRSGVSAKRAGPYGVLKAADLAEIWGQCKEGWALWCSEGSRPCRDLGSVQRGLDLMVF